MSFAKCNFIFVQQHLIKSKYARYVILSVFVLTCCGCSLKIDSKDTIRFLHSCHNKDQSTFYMSHPDFPRRLQFHYTVPIQYRYLFYESAELWNISIGAQLITIQNTVDYTNPHAVVMKNDGQHTIYWLSRYEMWNALIDDVWLDDRSIFMSSGNRIRILGLTLISQQPFDVDIVMVQDHIDSDIDVLYQYHHTDLVENYMKYIIMHEFGHVLGLDEHPDSKIMSPRLLEEAFIYDVVNDVDDQALEHLKCLYDFDWLRKRYPLDV